jgi:hypothetical protein
VLDRSRDRIDALLHRGAGRAAPPLRALSAGLGRASHAAERLPGLRRGEKRDTRVQEPRRGLTRVTTFAAMAGLTAGALIALRRRRTA